MSFNLQPAAIQDQQRPGSFKIWQIGSQDCMKVPQPPRMMYSIFWVRKGKGSITIDMDEYDLQDDIIFYIKPGQFVNINAEEQTQGYLISFDKQLLELFDKNTASGSHELLHHNFVPSQVIIVQQDLGLLLDSIADRMLQEFNGYSRLRAEVISSFLRIFIIYLQRHSTPVETEQELCRKSAIASQFFYLVDKHFVEKKLVKDYADIMLVTPGYLNRIIKDITGFTASYHIQQRIVLEAKRTLLSGGKNLKEIAYTLGFCDPAHFSKFFKSGAGTNFTTFKRSALGASHLI